MVGVLATIHGAIVFLALAATSFGMAGGVGWTVSSCVRQSSIRELLVLTLYWAAMAWIISLHDLLLNQQFLYLAPLWLAFAVLARQWWRSASRQRRRSPDWSASRPAPAFACSSLTAGRRPPIMG